jgi:hypothetical protein
MALPTFGFEAEKAITELIEKSEETIILTTIAKLSSGLDPQQALAAWYDLAAQRKVLRTLLKRAVAETARHAETL